jgi:hypothetical protein
VRRAEILALIDLEATENFINLTYAKWLRLPIKRLDTPRKLFNVDSTENKAGELQFYTNLQIQTGMTKTQLRFFLTDLREHKAILGYPWFAAVQPNIDWKKGWINYTQLPLVLRTHDTQKAWFIPRTQNHPQKIPETWYFIGRATIHPRGL